MHKIMKKYFLFVIGLISIYGCVNTPDTLIARLVYAYDTKLYSDSLYEVDIKTNKNAHNTRRIELRYEIKNETQTTYFFPINFWANKYKSHFEADIKLKEDTIHPYCYVNSVCYMDKSDNKILLSPKNSLLVALSLTKFDDWQKEGCTTNTKTEDIINMLNVQYIPSEDDRVDELHDFPQIDVQNNLDHVKINYKKTGDTTSNCNGI